MPTRPRSGVGRSERGRSEKGRPTLSRAKVLSEAVALADSEGLDALTMRALAERLGVVPMALYKHVGDKEDLIDSMVDAVIEEFPAAPAELPWREAVAAMLTGARGVVIAHPWARRALETRIERTPTVLAHMERVSQCFLSGGFTADQTHHVMHLLGPRIWGFSPELFVPAPNAEPPRKRKRPVEPPNPADYPAIMSIAADAQSRRPGAGCDEDFEFAFAVDVLLGAIERLAEQGFESPDG